MTYNVHRCVGTDGQLAPARVAEVIARHGADVVALQELDVARPRTALGDQPALLAKHLRMEYHFLATVRLKDEQFGDAVLSRLPMRLVKAGGLPALVAKPRLEPRGAVWVEVDCDGRQVQVINTHLSLNPAERLAQIGTLLGPEWLGDGRCRDPRLLVGDFNAWQGSAGYRRLRGVLSDAQQWPGQAWPRHTFPSRLPVLRLDHVFHGPGLTVRDVKVPRDRLTRTASDHLPVVVELEVS